MSSPETATGPKWRWHMGQLEEVACDACGSKQVQMVVIRADDLRVVECASCGLAFINPRPKKEHLSKFYGESYFVGSDDAKDTGIGYNSYATFAIPWLKLRKSWELEKIQQLMPLKGSRLLEIGCATGELLALAHSRGALTMGVEISEYAAQVAKERYGLEVRVGDLEHLDIPAESFDIILALEVIEHVLSPRAFLKEIALFLAPGGLVVLSTPNYACGRQLKEEWLGFRTSFEHLYFFTPEVLVHMAGSEGLDLLYWATAGSGKAAPLQTRKKMKAWLQKIPGGVVLGQMVKLFKDLTAKDPWVKFGQGHRLLAFFKSRGQGNDLVFDNP